MQYSAVVRRFAAQPAGKLFCLHGDRSVFHLSLFAASQALLAGVPIALVDGTNRFDVYYIAEFARRAVGTAHVKPEDLLDRIYVSRAFTCYQMEAVMTERLPRFAAQQHTPVIIVFGLLDTFYDEQAPLFEVKASVQRIIASLHKLKQQKYSVLLASLDVQLASAERNMLFPKVRAAMDEVFSVKWSATGPAVLHERSTAAGFRSRTAQEDTYGAHSTDLHNGNSAGDGKLDKIPPRVEEGRSRRSG